jgi:hypothetical protein
VVAFEMEIRLGWRRPITAYLVPVVRKLLHDMETFSYGGSPVYLWCG